MAKKKKKRSYTLVALSRKKKKKIVLYSDVFKSSIATFFENLAICSSQMFHSPAQNFPKFSFPTFFFPFFSFFFSYTIFSFLCSFSPHFPLSPHTTSLSPHNSSSYSPLMPPPLPTAEPTAVPTA